MRLKSSQVNNDKAPSASVSTSTNTNAMNRVGRSSRDFIESERGSLSSGILGEVPSVSWRRGTAACGRDDWCPGASVSRQSLCQRRDCARTTWHGLLFLLRNQATRIVSVTCQVVVPRFNRTMSVQFHHRLGRDWLESTSALALPSHRSRHSAEFQRSIRGAWVLLCGSGGRRARRKVHWRASEASAHSTLQTSRCRSSNSCSEGRTQ